MRIFEPLDRWVFRSLLILGCSAIVVLSAVCFYQVVARFVLHAPSVWSEALSRTLMVWAVFLGTPVVVRRRASIMMGVIAELAPKQVRRAIEVLVFLCVASALLIILWQGMFLLERISNQRLAGLNVPIVWAYAAVPTGAAFSLVAMLFNLIERYLGATPSPNAEVVK